MKVEQKIEKLKELNLKLTGLFAEPHIGLDTWNLAVIRTIVKMNSVLEEEEE
jgi:hypothetical protein